MTTDANVWTSPMWKSLSCIVKSQSDIPKTVSRPDCCNRTCGINRDLLEVTQVNYYSAVLSTEAISNVTMLQRSRKFKVMLNSEA